VSSWFFRVVVGHLFFSGRAAHSCHPSIRTLGERVLFARCRLGVLASAGAATCLSTFPRVGYCSFADSALASFRIGMSGSASFQRVKKSL
jgi:hypothetical protein